MVRTAKPGERIRIIVEGPVKGQEFTVIACPEDSRGFGLYDDEAWVLYDGRPVAAPLMRLGRATYEIISESAGEMGVSEEEMKRRRDRAMAKALGF